MDKIHRLFIAAGLSWAIASNCLADEPTSSGTGFAVTPDGWIMTNAHVVQGCGRVQVKGKGDAADPRIDEMQSQSLVARSGEKPDSHETFTTADLADHIAPSVFQILCYQTTDSQVTTIPPAASNAPPQPPVSPRSNLPTNNAAVNVASLEVPQARTGFVPHPKGVAPIKAAATSDAKALGEAANGSPVEVLELDDRGIADDMADTCTIPGFA